MWLQIFCHDFSYGLTVSNDGFDPFNLGMQFVKAGHYEQAISFLQVCPSDAQFWPCRAVGITSRCADFVQPWFDAN